MLEDLKSYLECLKARCADCGAFACWYRLPEASGTDTDAEKQEKETADEGRCADCGTFACWYRLPEASGTDPALAAGLPGKKQP